MNSMKRSFTRKILVAAATTGEGEALVKIPGVCREGSDYRFGNSLITLHVTGVGQIATAWSLTKWLSYNEKPDIAINIGIAGSFNENIKIGDVVTPVTDCFAGYGVETPGGTLSLAEAGLEDPHFRDGKIYAESRYMKEVVKIIRPVSSVTVNTVTGTLATIEKIQKRFHPDIETMEGASFFYICSRENTPFIALRAISNKVEPRDKDKWNIPLAIRNLTVKLEEVLVIIEKF